MLLGFRDVSSPRQQINQFSKNSYKFQNLEQVFEEQKQAKKLKEKKFKEKSEHQNRLNQLKLVPIYENYNLVIDPNEIVQRAQQNFPIESKYALNYLNSIIDKKEKKEILLETREIQSKSYLGKMINEIIEHDFQIHPYSKLYTDNIKFRKIMLALSKHEELDKNQIQRCIDFFIFRNETFLVLEKLPKTLSHYVKQYGSIDSIIALRKIALMIIKNLMFLNKLKISHNNLRLNSIGIELDPQYNIVKCTLRNFHNAQLYNHQQPKLAEQTNDKAQNALSAQQNQFAIQDVSNIAQSYNQIMDIKSLGFLIIRLKMGFTDKQCNDEEIKKQFNDWKGALSDQEYEFIDFIADCLSGRYKSAVQLLKKKWIQGYLDQLGR
eukprot:403356982